MNDSTKQPSTINIQVPTAESIAAKRSLIPVSFAAVIIFFFFSFVDFKCNGTTAESLTGYNLVLGTHLKNPVNSTSINLNPFLINLMKMQIQLNNMLHLREIK